MKPSQKQTHRSLISTVIFLIASCFAAYHCMDDCFELWSALSQEIGDQLYQVNTLTLNHSN